MTARHCPICKSSQISSVGLVRDWFLSTETGQFNLIRCLSCQSFFLDPPPSRKILKAAYPTGYWWDDSSTSLLGRLINAYRSFSALLLARNIDRHLKHQGPKKGLRVIELGSGVGTMLAAGRDNFGWSVVGVESSPQAAQLAKSINRLETKVSNIEKNLPNLKKFDVVILAHILEHIVQPQKFLKDLFRKIDEHASVVIIVPNAQSLGVKLFGLRWRGLDAPRHLRTYSPSGLETELAKAGFTANVVSRYSFRDDTPHFVGSFLSDWDPLIIRVRQEFIGQNTRPSWLKSLAFALICLLFQPIAYLESLLMMGETMMVITQKDLIYNHAENS